MTIQDIYRRLVDRFGEDAIVHVEAEALDPWIEVSAESIGVVGAFLKADPQLAYDQLCDLCGVDYFEPDPKLQKNFGHDPHIEVVYQVYSFAHKRRLTLKVKLPRWDNDEPGRIPAVPSVAHVWAIANWHERQTYDLMGIEFIGHPNLVRILCPDDWVGHPLRKDYEFPLEYHGIRGK